MWMIGATMNHMFLTRRLRMRISLCVIHLEKAICLVVAGALPPNSLVVISPHYLKPTAPRPKVTPPTSSPPSHPADSSRPSSCPPRPSSCSRPFRYSPGSSSSSRASCQGRRLCIVFGRSR